jgi:hypothetical protein
MGLLELPGGATPTGGLATSWTQQVSEVRLNVAGSTFTLTQGLIFTYARPCKTT